MRANRLSLLVLAVFGLLLTGCERETEEFKTEQIADYLPLQPGKYFTYRLDSTVFTQAGRAEETHSYQEKHVVDALVTDNLGRPSYRVFRFLRDVAGTQPWLPSGSYWITRLNNSAEVIEDNLRSIRLILPVKQDETWKGYRFLPDDPYSSRFGFDWNNDDNMEDWDFTYQAMNESLTLNSKTYNEVITLKHVDESINVPINSPAAYAYINFSEDKYAKGIGLIYQNLIMWEYQPNPGGSPFKEGFGVKRTLMENN
jgi:hypothetical protein